MPERLSPLNFALCATQTEALAAVEGMMDRDTAARRGNQAEAGQAVEHGYELRDLPCPRSDGEPGGRIVVAWPKLSGAGPDTLVAYYGPPLTLSFHVVPPATAPRVRRRPVRLVRAA